VHYDSGGTLRWAKYNFGTWPTSVSLGGASDVTYSIYATGPGGTGSSATPTHGIVSGVYAWQPPSTLTGAKFSATGLPGGLAINALTGEVTGKPNASGTFTVKIVETKGRTVSRQTYTLIVDAFPAGIAGSYSGLVERDAVVNGDLGGSLAITVSATGAVTGRLYHAATRYPLTGRVVASLDTDPIYTLTIPRKGANALAVSLTFALSNAVISGTISGVAVNARHHLVVPPGTPNSANTLNAFLTIPAGDIGDAAKPQGTGWLRLTQSLVSRKASISAAGKLGDGTTITLAASVCDNLDSPLRCLLYSGKGSLQGTTRITASLLTAWPPVYLLSGTLDWKKLSRPSSADYSYATISESLTVSGRSHAQPATGLTYLGNTDTANNAKIEFSEGGMSSAYNADQTFQLTSKHKALFGNATINPSVVTLSIDATKGTFTGTLKLKDGSTLRMVNYSGLFTSDVGEGYFNLPQLPLTKSSSVLSGKVKVSVPY
jgi:hypothetical protein